MSMTMLTGSPVTPDDEAVAVAAEALELVQACLRAHPQGPATVRLVDEDGDQLVVPRGAVELLARILAHMASRDDARRRAAADELAVLAQDIGLD
jgi:hypothetical protein